jgi:L-threonylcarbamoyladenylate synthase
MLYDCRDVAERDRGIAAAIDAVKSGELVVMPTDTLYGIGADAFTGHAVQALLNAKGGQNPPPVLVGSRHTLDGLVLTLPRVARDLVEAFWPGALTIVVEHAPSLRWDLGAADGTVLVRMPMHPVALEVLRETGPMAVASANKLGQKQPRCAEEARDQIGYAVRVYLESGVIGEPVPSTVVDVRGEVPQVLRQGALSLDVLRTVVPDILGLPD